jgi:anti-anti-sigma factor
MSARLANLARRTPLTKGVAASRLAKRATSDSLPQSKQPESAAPKPQTKPTSKPEPTMSTDWSDNIVVIDLADEPALSDELAGIIQRVDGASARGKGKVPSVVLNCASVTYVSSSNLAQLLTLSKKLAEAGRSMRMCALNETVRSTFEVTGLAKLFRFAPDPMTALAGLQMEESP